MQNNEDNDAKKYDSVRKAVKELREQSLDQDDHAPAEVPAASSKQTPVSSKKSLSSDDIDDERLYESTDSSYDSIFLSKSMVERAEAMASAEIIAPPVPKKALEQMQNFNKKPQGKTTTVAPESVDEIGAINEALAEIEQTKPKLDKLAATTPRSIPDIANHSSQVTSRRREEEPEQIGEITLSLHSKWMMGLILILLLLAPLSNLLLRPTSTATTSVQALASQRQDIQPQIIASGRVVAANPTRVRMQVAGRVIQVLVKTGDVVRKGDPLFRLQQPQIAEALRTAQANLTQAFARWKEAALYRQTLQKKYSDKEDKASSEYSQKFEQLQQQLLAQLTRQVSSDPHRLATELKKYRLQGEEIMSRYLQENSAAAIRLYLTEVKYRAACREWGAAAVAVASAQERLQQQQVLAPVDGKVLQLQVSPGMDIDSGMTAVVLADPGDKQVVAVVREVYLPYLQDQAGKLEARIQIPASGNKYLPGTINAVTIAPQAIGCQLRLAFSQKHPEIRFGLPVQVEISLPIKTNCLVVPHQAIVFKKNVDNSYPVVYTLRPEGQAYRLQGIPVKLGIADRRSVEIVAGLHGDELIATGCRSGMENLYDDMIVTVD